MRISEIYSSIQCEGPKTGEPTTFVRFGGCNMRCPGWPCDTLYAVLPEFRNDWEKLTPIEVLGKTPHWPKNICITGGEPFLQKDSEMISYVEMLTELGHTVEFFTNGSFEFPKPIIENGLVTFMMDWKLTGSGESNTNIEQRRANALALGALDGIKFVITDVFDLFEAAEVFKEIRDFTEAQFWVGAAWDVMTVQEVLEFVEMNRLPWKINVQVHKYIWPPDERGV